jgi:hypothetical protein
VEGVLDRDDIGSDALWRNAVEGVSECFALIVRSTELLAGLLDELAVLEAPQPVYRDDVSGAVSLTDPRLRGSTE